MNIELILAAAVLLLIAFSILFPALWKKRQVTALDVEQQNIAIARQKLDELKNQLQSGFIDQQQYEAQVTELETALSDDLERCQTGRQTQQQGRWIIAAIAVVLPVVAVTLYLALGDPGALNRPAQPTAAENGAAGGNTKKLGSVAEMVTALSKRLKDKPDDTQGWIMLGKSYKYMKQYKKAVEAFDKANVLAGQQPDVMLLYADALVMENGGRFTDKARQLIFKALEFTPNDTTGLWLAGLATAEQGKFNEALGYMQQVATLLPPDSESLQEVQGIITKLQSLSAGDATAAPATPSQANGGPTAGAIEDMVKKLEQRLATNPDDLQGWIMLGKSYKFLQQYNKAVAAFEKANVLSGKQADVMLLYADALVMDNSGHFTDQAKALIFKALALAPEDSTGLWLAGKAKVEEGAYIEALGYLRKAENSLPPDSQSHAELQRYIAGVEAQMPAAAGVSVKPAAAGIQTRQTESLKPGIRVSVKLSPELQSRAAVTDTLFIYARATSGPQMPLAVVRKQVKDLPLTVTLSDDQALTPSMQLSKYEQVNLTARISKSGNAIQQPGDLIGSAGNVNVAGQQAVDINIDGIVN